MWVIAHASTGLALAALAPLPLPALLVLALLLHVVLDAVPHWDYTRHRYRALWAILDAAASIALVAGGLALGVLPLHLALTAGVSALPDLDVLDAVIPRMRTVRWFPSHWAGFPHGRCSARVGIPLQSGLVIASLALVLITL